MTDATPIAVGCTCDFSGGTRGMDRCHRCDGTGSRLAVSTSKGVVYFPNTETGHASALARIDGELTRPAGKEG